MIIKILGTGCANCQALERAARAAAAELGLDARIEKVTDPADIAAHGVLRTPGLVVDGRVVLSGKVPGLARVRDLLAAEAHA